MVKVAKEGEPRCPSVCDGLRCEFVEGHWGKHRNTERGFEMWSDAGAARIAKEQQELKQQ